MSDLKQLAAITALNTMLKGRYFDVCTITKVAELLDIQPEREAMATLRVLHCMDYDKMPQELRAAVPGLIHQCLAVTPVYQFPMPVLTKASFDLATVVCEQAPEAKAEPKRRGFLQLLRF